METGILFQYFTNLATRPIRLAAAVSLRREGDECHLPNMLFIFKFAPSGGHLPRGLAYRIRSVETLMPRIMG